MAIEKGAFLSPATTVANLTLLHIYIYIYIYIYDVNKKIVYDELLIKSNQVVIAF